MLGAPRLLTDVIYFIDSGVVSLAKARSGSSAKVALVSREGVAGNYFAPTSLFARVRAASRSTIRR
jgi:hypothetical protein